ncbi:MULTISPECIES: phosphoribosyltransferase-like protein [unclassified Flavobacterium]|uniref:phosphoribosyltransferase-like protein n=1 Tax=unclassified Flavobacterium TaxID=196869 RepID=UPI003F910834
MEIQKKHTFSYNENSLRKVENLLARLKHSVLPTKIIRWLENFDEDEVDLAIDLLSVYEYIPFNELMFRLNDLLYELYKSIPKGDKIIIFPYGKVGKSGTLVTYPLKNTNAFKKRENDILLTHDYKYVTDPGSYNHIVFLDDFIGSGKTFCKEFSKPNDIQQWLTDNNIENIYILSSIIMVEGKKHILDRYPQVKIISEERNKIFEPTLSPLNILGNLSDIEKTTLKHGENLKVGPYPYVFPYGFDNSQSLISYFHCTPNNTLSIIWGKNRNWTPLFPRMANIRMREAREFKQDIAFYIGICNRLKIDLYSGKSIIEKKDDKFIRKIKYNSKLDHSVIALLTLINERHDIVIICHLLGLTRTELKKIYNKAKQLGFLNVQYNISNRGIQFLKELKRKTQKENFRKETKENLEVKDVLYLPTMFNGLT